MAGLGLGLPNMPPKRGKAASATRPKRSRKAAGSSDFNDVTAPAVAELIQ